MVDDERQVVHRILVPKQKYPIDMNIYKVIERFVDKIEDFDLKNIEVKASFDEVIKDIKIDLRIKIHINGR